VVPHGGLLEKPHIAGQVPGKVAVSAYHLVAAHGGYGADDHRGEAMEFGFGLLAYGFIGLWG
jgi:hypothetical protein